MHLFMIVDGNFRWIHKLKCDLSDIYYGYSFRDKIRGRAQLNVRNVELWDLTFHEQNLERVLNDLRISKRVLKAYPLRWRIAREALRIGMGLQEIPDIEFGPTDFRYKYVHLIPIGLKNDKYKDGVEQI